MNPTLKMTLAASLLSLTPAMAANEAKPAQPAKPAAAATTPAAAPAAAPAASNGWNDQKAQELMGQVEAKLRRGGDWKALMVMENKEKAKKKPSLSELAVYNRDDGKSMVLLMTKPKVDSGKGYLLQDRNVWFYDPSVGRWERRTERDRIAGSTARRSDFDAPRFTEQFDISYDGEELVGKLKTIRMTLKAKPGVEMAYPVIKIWVDPATQYYVKDEGYALSGKLLRSAWYSNWQTVHSEAKKADVHFASEIRFISSVEDIESTLVVKAVDARPHAENIFTKAWLESRSR